MIILGVAPDPDLVVMIRDEERCNALGYKYDDPFKCGWLFGRPMIVEHLRRDFAKPVGGL